MDGTVLHYDPAGGGLIRGQDGSRYAFAAADWNGAAPPVPGQAVDFDTEGEAARRIYPLPVMPEAAPATAVPPPPAGPPPPAFQLRPFLADRPGLPFALVILVACFLPFLSLGFFSVNLFTLVDVTGLMGSFSRGSGNVQFGLMLFYLLYAVPLVAVWVAFQELRRAAGTGTRIGGGLFCLAGPFAIVIGAGELIKSAGPRGRGAPDFNLLSNISFGWIVMAIAAAGLLAVGLGWSPFGMGNEDVEDVF
jgi:hypothetical protein